MDRVFRGLRSFTLGLCVLCTASQVLHSQTSGYSYQRAFVINHSLVSGGDQSNFPVLISGTFADLATTANGGNVQNSQGYDIVFTSDATGQHPLPFEQESYSATTGAINYWVQVPTLSHSSDTAIYMFYGNSSITTDQSAKASVWDANYQGVWHLANGITVNASDSTSNANNGTINGSISAAAGKIDGAAVASGGSNNGILMPTSITADTSPFTYSFWMNSSGGGIPVLRGEDSFGNGWSATLVVASNILFAIVNSSPAQVNLTSTATISAGTWYHVDAVWAPGSGMKLYINGVLDNSNTDTSTSLRSSTKGLQLFTANSSNTTFEGSLDEVEISNVARSAGWIATEYNNQSSPSTFAVACPAQTAGSSGADCLRPSPTASSYVRAITFNHSLVANSDQQNFPVLITGTYPDLAAAANGGKVQSAQGYDIVFTSDSAGLNVLDHEIDTYDPVTGAINFWVRIPALSHNTDTTIYMWYGNSAVTSSQENRSGVWSNGYAAVYHMGNGNSLSGSDSTGNNPGTLTNVVASAGVVGSAGSFSGSSSITAIPATSVSGAFTLEAWASPSTTSGILGLYGSRAPQDQSFDAKLYSGAVYEDIGNGTSWLTTNVNANFAFSSGAWHHYAHVLAANAYQVYADGRQIGSGTFSGTPLLLDSNHNLLIGESGYPGEGFSGALDEVRVSTVARSADWIATEYNNLSSASNFAVVCQGEPTGGSAPSCSLQPPTSSYANVRTVTFNHTKVPNTDQLDFPALISGTYTDLANVANGGKVQNLHGYDIVFTSDSAGQNRLDHEIDTYNPTTGAVNFWVRLPTLSHTSDTSIYMWFGNSAITSSQENKGGVWSNGYAAVYHMGNNGLASGNDSTGNDPGNLNNVSSASAVISGGGSFNGSASISAVPAASVSGSFTIEEWANPSTTSGILGLYGSRTPSDQSFDAKLYSGAIYEDIGSGTSWLSTNVSVNFPFSPNIWHHFAHTLTANAYQVYVDGRQISSGSFSGTPLLLDTNHDFLIGESGFTGEGFSGLIDEARVSTVVRSADWIATEYNNENSPGTFFSISGETPSVAYPQVTTAFPLAVGPGTQVTINGTNFGSTQQSGAVVLNNTLGTVVSWSNTQVVVSVPTGTSGGNLYLQQNGLNSNAVTFVTPTPQIASINPASGSVGTQITISGSGFGGTPETVTVNGTAATIQSWSDTQVLATVTAGTTTGDLRVVDGGASSNALTFTVVGLQIANVSPTSGLVGTQVTISGSGFGASQSTRYVTVGTTPGTVASWSDTQIIAAVASGSTSGVVQIVGGEANSNSVSFTVNSAIVSAVTPTSGAAGTQVAVTGSGFGATQGNGMVWLGTAPGVVSSWSDTELDAVVAQGSTSGNAQVLQNGAWSNSVEFTVQGIPRIQSISPNSGPVGTTVTISGSGFGASQGNSTILIGGTSASVVGWGDRQIQGVVSSSALTGVVKVQENGVWSNSVAFKVSGNSGSGTDVTLMPDVINMAVGDTRSIQAIGSNDQPVAGLAWSSSDTTIATLSADDPPVITAVAPGNVTITAGDASADITVYAGSLPLGTVIWSNPGDGSGVQQIVPAVPSSTGIADVFALQNDCSVQALASDGSLGWAANIGASSSGSGCKHVVPDFQGGFVAIDLHTNSSGSVQRFDGMTGQAYPAYTVAHSPSNPSVAVHTDGTVFVVDGDSLVALDPSTGLPKFSIRMEHSTFTTDINPNCTSDNSDNVPATLTKPIIAGDGFAYLLYNYSTGSRQALDSNCSGNSFTDHEEEHLRLLRVGADGSSSEIVIADSTEDLSQDNGPEMQSGQTPGYDGFVITNADQGVLLALHVLIPNYCTTYSSDPSTGASENSGCVPAVQYYQMITTSGSSVASNATVPSEITFMDPILQAQDGSFYGFVDYADVDGGSDFLAKFDASGNIQWSVPNYYPLIATADGGVIAQSEFPYDDFQPSEVPSYFGPAITFDAIGNQTGQVANLPMQSWVGSLYTLSSAVTSTFGELMEPASSFSAFTAANPSFTPTAVRLHRARVFIPYGLYAQPPTCGDSNEGCTPPLTDAKDATWRTAALNAIHPWESAMDIRLYNDAKFGDYLLSATAPSWGVVKRTNEIVAYFGHGVVQPDASSFNFPPQYGDPSVAMGLLFPNTECFWFNNLKAQPLPTSPPTPWDFSCDKGARQSPTNPALAGVDNVTQKPRIVFLGICGVTTQFIQDWIVDTDKQVLVYPAYASNDTSREISIGLAANEYLAFLKQLLQGSSTVADAIAYANTITQQDIDNANLPSTQRWTWKAYGNTNLTFNPPLQ